MVTQIKPIETRYKGYRMRSRLEARWAVFFDALEIPWEYEKEGFDLGEAGWYLPDFWLPSLDCWLEIKAQTPTKKELWLCEALSNGGGKASVIAGGTPGQERLSVYCSDCTDSGGGTGWWDCPTGWCSGGPHWIFDEGLYICSGNDWSSRSFYDPWFRDTWHGMRTVSMCRHATATNAKLARAYNAARSARFEHGEGR